MMYITLHMSLAGRGRRTSSFSRSSSGFESSHLLSPETPIHPLMLAHPSCPRKTTPRSPQDGAPCLPGLTRPQPLCRALARSWSYEELRDTRVKPAPPWRCLSLEDLQNQPGPSSPLEDLELTEASTVVVEGKQQIWNLYGNSPSSGSVSVTFVLDQNPVAAREALVTNTSENNTIHTAGKQLLPNQKVFPSHPGARPAPPHPGSPKAASTERDVDVACPSGTPMDSRDRRDVDQVRIPQLQWSGITPGNLGSLESLVEERLQTHGIDLTTEPFSDKVTN